MSRKLYPQPSTKAERKEFFVSIRDGNRKLFDLFGPVQDDASLGQRVIDANNTRGNHWNICACSEGPRLAESVRSEIQGQFSDYVFVESALAHDPVPVTITRQPLEWTVP